MVDVDSKEIKRLKEKYQEHKNIQLYNVFLGIRDEKVDLRAGEHKGYTSSKEIDLGSFWFGRIRHDEAKTSKVSTIDSLQSGPWVKSNLPPIDIIKLDIEGGELDFLIGMGDSISSISAIIAECHLDSPYQTSSNFGSISQLLKSKNFVLASADLQTENINEYHGDHDGVPINIDATFINRSIIENISKVNANNSLQILFALELHGFFFDVLLSHSRKLKKENLLLYDEIKFYIGTTLNRKQKDVTYKYEKANKIYRNLFDEDLPRMSDFYESDFFNPI